MRLHRYQVCIYLPGDPQNLSGRTTRATAGRCRREFLLNLFEKPRKILVRPLGDRLG